MMAGAILAILAGSVVAWWIALYVSPEFRAWFCPPDQWDAFTSFLAADIAVAATCAAAAWQALRGRRPLLLVAFAAGGWTCATLMTIAWTRHTGVSWLGAIAMVAGWIALLWSGYAMVPPRASRHD